MLINLESEYVVKTCPYEKCGIHYAIPSKFDEERRNDHKTFYCPNGHSIWYPGKSEIEKLQDVLERKDGFILNRDKEIANLILEKKQIKNSRAAYKAHLTRLRKRNNPDG